MKASSEVRWSHTTESVFVCRISERLKGGAAGVGVTFCLDKGAGG